ncbi:hypothetical protein AXA44_20065 [Rhodococcus sp. SC4]|uniref:hypothetical protein n=1 Tax=Rhodococcus sp. LB1 TaxID=1807499 RepID=UPI00076A9BB5|nr:hypothetical protein [Rhodococcus sp. LB1]KXF50334.1 hypothetical protein AXA44_20065 [Rhodococcus sp. SC4]KXX58578.1 hypothetical protein AZG88_45030 [Rhodococcus sp. LB1]RYE42768.1 MAG: hypothetical protein EOP24_31230 [Hyphomicrobiales bacterium]
MSTLKPVSPVVAYEASLGRNARVGSWEELAQGTFRTAVDRFRRGLCDDAAALVEVTVLEAEELREIYEQWPDRAIEWMSTHGASADDVDAAVRRLTDLIGETAMAGIEAEWGQFVEAVDVASEQCRRNDPAAPGSIENARLVWLGIHDRAVDRISGTIDIAVRLIGESSLGDLWNFLMGDWYDIHARRYSLTNQSWNESAHQLMVAIVDGFHAHLTGVSRQGDIELIDEPDRIGFRFAPCGSGGRSLDPDITADEPRADAPFGFAVTTEPHDWAWNKRGICSYCVHCCLLNEVIPIDRLGYPTRVIDPPTWPESRADATCTWWVYKHPSLVPDDVYRRVGRNPELRPKDHNHV